MPIRYHEDANGYLVYENTRTGQVVHVWDEDLEDAMDICEEWHGGRGSPCHRMVENDDLSYRNLRSVLGELRRVQRMADGDSSIDGDDYLDLLTTIEDLEGIIARIDRIADR